jgi:hypothetical protein
MKEKGRRLSMNSELFALSFFPPLGPFSNKKGCKARQR